MIVRDSAGRNHFCRFLPIFATSSGSSRRPVLEFPRLVEAVIDGPWRGW